jgi:hypothetical protein
LVQAPITDIIIHGLVCSGANPGKKTNVFAFALGFRV